RQMLRCEPRAFLSLQEPLRDPDLGEIGLPKPPTPEGLEAMRAQCPISLYLTRMQRHERDPPADRANGHWESAFFSPSSGRRHHSAGPTSRLSARSRVFCSAVGRA